MKISHYFSFPLRIIICRKQCVYCYIAFRHYFFVTNLDAILIICSIKIFVLNQARSIQGMYLTRKLKKDNNKIKLTQIQSSSIYEKLTLFFFFMHNHMQKITRILLYCFSPLFFFNYFFQ